MSKISFKAIPKKFNNGSYLLLPATPVDRQTLNVFSENIGNNFVTVIVNHNRGTKSYDQVKAVFALINIRFYLNNHRYPTDTEQAKEYSDLLWRYASREAVAEGSEETAPIPLSAMSKSQAAAFIGSIITEIYEYMGNNLTDTMQVELKQIFEEFQSENGQGEGNPVDFDSKGNLLSVEEWCKRNNISMASGINDGTLEIAHIVSKGKREDLRNCVWNFLRLTHHEHIEIQHKKGWGEFLNLYPHLLPRVKAAYDKAGELYPFTENNTEPDVKENLTTEKQQSFIF